MVKVREPQITLLASDHSKRAHIFTLESILIPQILLRSIAEILHQPLGSSLHALPMEYFGKRTPIYQITNTRFDAVGGRVLRFGGQKVGFTPHLIWQGAPNRGL
eukprot:1160794-Pelagomonas_calceolata.AAC.1